jgi:ethanolamine ammonia-lyase small subunit
MSLLPLKSLVQPDAWSSLRTFTAARIALGRTGVAIPLKEVLALKMAHAHARDAVYAELATATLPDELNAFQLPVFKLRSQAQNRLQYLQDPGLGRQLDASSIPASMGNLNKGGVVIILADGLSATSVNTHAVPLLQQLVPNLQQSGKLINSIILVEHGRVAISDEIGSICKADMSVMLIGERPGLTAADSMGAYLTYQPFPGLTDESRNCVSNIHAGGLSYTAAAGRITYLVNAAFHKQQSGVSLKEEEERLLD